jgi:hypothetical protein
VEDFSGNLRRHAAVGIGGDAFVLSNAAECLRLVRTAFDSTNKALLFEMAQAWIRLAERQKAEGE